MEFPSLKTPAIIAFKGLPVTLKSFTAAIVAKWAKSPVFFIEDFLAPDASPSMDEAQHILRCAFDALCRVAERQARDSHVNCVVIKSRLYTAFELDRLIDLMIRCDSHALLIIDCRNRSEYQRRIHFKEDYHNDKHWYKPKTWDAVEMATTEYDAQAWDLHFENMITALSADKRPNVQRLVIDYSDATVSVRGEQVRIGLDFSWVIKVLLSKDAMVQLPNTKVYRDFRRVLVEFLLNSPREKSERICTGEHRCAFKYREAFEADVYCCSVCEKSIFGPGYECFECNLVLHKSCAEEPTMVTRPEATPYLDLSDEMVNGSHFKNPYYHFTEEHACEHCEAFSYECMSCLLYTHLKCRLMPTIIKHECHPEHFLQVQFEFCSDSSNCTNSFTCNGCTSLGYFSRYICWVCGCGYHIRCLAAPSEVTHKHGGYEHVMQLMYSFDGMEKQEDFWCDNCQMDMDSTKWFYHCKECPYYVSHMDRYSRLPC